MTHHSLQPLQTLETLTEKGRAKSFLNNIPVEVIGGLENETLEVLIIKGSKRQKIAKALHIITPSIHRVAPLCPHVPDCGGCAIQHMEVGAQLALKEQALKRYFSKFNPRFFPIIACKSPWRYRNKMEFSFSSDKEGNRYLGLMLTASAGKVLSITSCQLVNPWMMQVLEGVRTFWGSSSLLAYKRDDTGTLRTLTLREGIRTKEKMVILTVSGNPAYALTKTQLNAFKEVIVQAAGDQVSLFLIIQQIKKGHPTQFFEMHLHGKDHIEEKLVLLGKEYRFKISPTSFFQPNTRQAEALYEAALSHLHEFGPIEHALDLYSGTSTFSLVLSLIAKKVTAIEINPHAVFDAQDNLHNNQIENVTLLQGDVAKELLTFDQKVDLVALDPPRAGCGPKGIEQLLKLKAKILLYISCNPKTQAIDVEALVQAGYTLKSVQGVDQFPHTMHCENICVLEYQG